MALPDAVSHHIRVRRLKAGQPIVLFDGTGIESNAILQFETGGQPFATIVTSETVDRELPWRLTLVQGIASQDKMDWIIEKAVELGVSTLLPVMTERSVVKLSHERATKRVQHWQKLVLAASEQCGRNQLMQIHSPCNTTAAIAQCQEQPLLWCHIHGDTRRMHDPEVIQAVLAHQRACLIVGPEGGFSQIEANAWQQAGAQSVSLGPRVLRTETAGLAAAASLTALLSAMG